MSKAKISKTELISAVADNVKESQKVVADVVNAALDVIAENLKDGVDVTIMDFGRSFCRHPSCKFRVFIIK